MATRLQVLNEALRYIGENPLATDTDDVEARYALDDAYDRAVTFVLRVADWKFALATEALTNDTGTPPQVGYTYRFVKPANFLRTQALFVQAANARECPFDAREDGAAYHSNVDNIIVRYVSSANAGEDHWTEHFTRAVAAYLAFLIVGRITGNDDAARGMNDLYQGYMEAAVTRDALQPSPWLRYQLDGTLARALTGALEHAPWRFATKTVSIDASGTPSPNYAYRFQKPDDWIKTVETYFLIGSSRRQEDYRDEAGAIHADRTPLILRYVSSDAFAPTMWPEYFIDALLARCQYEEARTTNRAGDALAIWKDALRTAESRDEGNEEKRVVGPGVFAAGRQGGFGRFGRNREQGWPS